MCYLHTFSVESMTLHEAESGCRSPSVYRSFPNAGLVICSADHTHNKPRVNILTRIRRYDIVLRQSVVAKHNVVTTTVAQSSNLA